MVDFIMGALLSLLTSRLGDNIIIMIGLGGTTETTIPHQSAPSPIPAVWSLSLLSVSIVCRLSAPPGGEDDSLRNEAQSAGIG